MATAPAHLAGKAPPYSVASEKLILSALLCDPKLLGEIGKRISSADTFFRPEHGRLYNQIIAIQREAPKISADQLCTALSSQGVQIAQFLQSPACDGSAAIQHAEHVAEKARQRTLIDTLSHILHDGYQCTDGCDAVIKRAKKRLTELERASKPATKRTGKT